MAYNLQIRHSDYLKGIKLRIWKQINESFSKQSMKSYKVSGINRIEIKNIHKNCDSNIFS